jgi:hypothetical protein
MLYCPSKNYVLHVMKLNEIEKILKSAKAISAQFVTSLKAFIVDKTKICFQQNSVNYCTVYGFI